jgi:hypothetical protein
MQEVFMQDQQIGFSLFDRFVGWVSIAGEVQK